MNDNLSQSLFGPKYRYNSEGYLTHIAGLPVSGMKVFHSTDMNSAQSIMRGESKGLSVPGHIYAQHHDEGSFGQVVLSATLPKDVKLSHGQDNYTPDAHGFVGDDSRDAQIDGDIIINQARTPLKWSIHRVNED